MALEVDFFAVGGCERSGDAIGSAAATNLNELGSCRGDFRAILPLGLGLTKRTYISRESGLSSATISAL